MTDKEQFAPLVPGQRYAITIEDCCVIATITDVFVSSSFDEEGNLDALVFEHITFGTAYASAVKFGPV